MKHYIIAGALASMLSGCELVFLPLLPIGMAVSAASITQPVSVVSSSGKVLASPPQTSIPAKSRFVITEGTVLCRHKGALPSSNVSSSIETFIDISCSNGMNGKARISEDMISDRFQLNVTGEQVEGISCDGLFRSSGDTQGPFLINCKHTEGGTVATRQAAVSTGPTASGNYSVAVWLE